VNTNLSKASTKVFFSVVFLLFSADFAVAQDPNLVAWWMFDEGSGTVAVDSAGGFNGTLTNGPVWTSGRINGAINFNGGNEYVDCGTTVGTLGTTDFTFTGWIYLDTLTSGGVLGNFYNSIPNFPNYWLWVNYNKHLECRLEFGSGSRTITNSDSALSTGKWYHFAFVVDRSDAAYLFIDGVAQADYDNLSSYPRGFDKNNTFAIGRYSNTYGLALDGSIDDVRLYDKVLSQEQIYHLAYPENAHYPDPADGQTEVSIFADISWTAGDGATSHDVYFGTDNPPVSLVADDIIETSYDPGVLDFGAEYFWRVDENGPGGPYTGKIWSFTTYDGMAENPTPADGATGVHINDDLSWTAGEEATSHEVYFGTDNSPPWVANTTDTTYDPGTMVLDATYYWRIDENNPYDVITGQVWSFTVGLFEGTGTTDDPYLIYDANDMQAIGSNSSYWGSHFKLMNDIDLGGFTGTEFNIIGNDSTYFTGVFDGNGKTLSNFNYTSSGASYIGIFGYVTGASAEIRDLFLVDPNVNSGSSGYATGSLVGALQAGTVTGCCAEGGSVSGYQGVGGLVGYNSNGTVSKCYATCQVSSAGSYVGGLIGNNNGTLTNCYATGQVSSAGGYIGGLAGNTENSSSIVTNCYATGDVSGSSMIGGLTGREYFSSISNSYATGFVSGNNYLGGLTGYNRYCTISSSYWDSQTTGRSNMCGTCQDCSYCNDSYRRTTVQMMQQATFGGWDFADTWGIDEGLSYPFLLALEDKAFSPAPANGATGVSIDADLNWTGGFKSTSRDVYFGTDNPPAWAANITETTYEPGTMALDNTTYYWRIDEISPGGIATGDVWSFTTTLWPGDGVEDDPYLIYDANDMQMVGMNPNQWDAHFKLMADIDLSGFTGEEFNIIGVDSNEPFSGGFYGNDHIISNFRYSTSAVSNNIGLFGYTDTAAKILNVSLVSADVNTTASNYVGALVGQNHGLVEGCYSTGQVSGAYGTGGLVGWNNTGQISRCYSDCDILGNDASGGLAGENTNGTVSNNYATGNISAAGSYTGGLVGFNSDSSSAVIENCYSTGLVSGNESTGGLIGINYSGSAAIDGSYWDTQTSSLDNMCGSGDGCDDSKGKSTAQMMQKPTFESWDFTRGWNILEDRTYPFFYWHCAAGDINCDGVVNFIDIALFAGNWLAGAQ